MNKIKIGVGIFSFDRPDYLSRQIKSIQESPYIHDCEFHLFQDGAQSRFSSQLFTHPTQILECIKIFSNAKLPDKHVHARATNAGIAINQYEGLKELCNSYEAVMLVEDDVILSPHWFKLAKLLLEQFKDKEDMYAFSPGYKKYGINSSYKEFLPNLMSGNIHHWVDVFWSERWLRIEPLFLQYYELIKDVEYRYRPHTEIIKFFDKVENPQKGVTSQDSAKYWALTKMGMKRYHFQVNRALYIGQKGQHFNPEFYERNKFGEQHPFIFEEDKDLKEFHICEN